MDFFTQIFYALRSSDVETKRDIVHYFMDNIPNAVLLHDAPIETIDSPSYASFCNILHPTRINRPKEALSNVALAKILHSIAHIEYSAIDLGLDALYRFRNLPLEYYCDFLVLASEEVCHFNLLESLLKRLGFAYGSFAVHDNLFHAMKQSDTLITRMALVHKGLEAMGLDANPFVRQKIAYTSHALKGEILDALDRILHDEVGHVAKGSKWLDYARQVSGDNRTLAEILQGFRDFNVIGKITNIEARLQAGYSMQEINTLLQLHGYTK